LFIVSNSAPPAYQQTSACKGTLRGEFWAFGSYFSGTTDKQSSSSINIKKIHIFIFRPLSFFNQGHEKTL